MRLLEEINKKIESFLCTESNDNDATDGVFDFWRDLSDSVQAEFNELLAADNDKKLFVRTLSKIFALLLNTKVDTAQKITCIIKIVVETTLKIWQESKP